MSLLVRWFACDLASGDVIEELPDLVPAGPLGRDIGDHATTTFQLPLVAAGSVGAPPAGWREATQPGRTMLVAVTTRPIWAGLVLVRDSGSAPTATLATATPEAFLRRRRIGDHDWTGQDISTVVAAGLVGDALTEGINLAVDADATGTLVDRVYYANSDRSVWAALDELMGTGLLEWTVDVDWGVEGRSVTLTVHIASRIGTAAPPTGPSAIFETSASSLFESAGTSDVRYNLTESYADGDGATQVIATSVGQGDLRPESAPARADALISGGMPRWEYWYNPDSSVVEQADLDAHAQQTLAVTDDGALALQISARADTYPQLGEHWFLGDDIGYSLVGPAHPAGLSGQARAVGWRLDTLKSVVTPTLILQEPP